MPFFAISILSLLYYSSSNVGGKIEYLWGLCIAQFRRDVWGFLLERKEVSGEYKAHLMNADVPLCYHALKLYLVDKEPWFVTGNKADIKTIPTLAAYLFDEEPYAVDPGEVWVKDAGPASLLREFGLKEKCLAYDAHRIMERAKDEEILQIGGRLQANAEVELAMPCALMYTAEWHGLLKGELEDKLCHDAVYLADRETQIEARWRTRHTVVRLDDCARPYGLRSRLNTERVEANDELDTLSSDSRSCQGSDDEWDGTISSGDGSAYNPRRRSRRKTALKKMTERES
ncbi:hypothetical protein BGZ57DRAFT_1011135 [Hyaloscypha finlandica]|nr:hypothetical protein BGZ57DRAFT_1011135 [Hyaloscypha finlandica]